MSDVLSIEKNSNGLPEAKVIDSKGLTDSLQKLNGSVAANSNLNELFSKKIKDLNNRGYKNINDPVRELNYALEAAKKGNINQLTAELGLETIKQTQKNQEDAKKMQENAEKTRQQTVAEEAKQRLADQAQKLATTQDQQKPATGWARLTDYAKGVSGRTADEIRKIDKN